MISERECVRVSMHPYLSMQIHKHQQEFCVCEREGEGGARDQRIDRIFSIMTLLICLLLSIMSID